MLKKAHIAAVLVCLAAASSSACASKSQTAQQVAPASGGLSAVVSPLDDPDVTGLTLEQALTKAHDQIVLPEEATVGAATKVLVDDTPGLSRDEVGLAIGYASGLGFYFKPLPPTAQPDFHAQLKDTSDTVKFTDGRKQPFEIVLIDGIEVAAREAGTLSSDISGEIPMEAQVQWCVDEGTYTLRSETLEIGELLSIARDLIDQGARPARM